MTEAIKRVAKRLSEDERAGIIQMLNDNCTHKLIIEKYHVSAGTISGIVKKLAADHTPIQNESQNVASLKETLNAIKIRKAKVEEMLMGSLKNEFEQLTVAEENLEKTIASIIALEAYTHNK